MEILSTPAVLEREHPPAGASQPMVWDRPPEAWSVEMQTALYMAKVAVRPWNVNHRPASITVFRGDEQTLLQLMQVLTRQQLPAMGTVRIQGKRLEEWCGDTLRRGMGVYYGLLRAGHTVLDSLWLQHPDLPDPERQRRTEQFCSQYDFPLGVALNAECQYLSGGAAARVNLLRVMLHAYSIVVFHEPDGLLDRAALQWLRQRLQDWKQHRTALPPDGHKYAPTVWILSRLPTPQWLEVADETVTL